MTRQPVTSSTLHSVGYDAKTRTLEIQFHSGGVYQYSNVPPWIHRVLLLAHSKGRYFNRVICGHYPYRKIKDLTQVPA